MSSRYYSIGQFAEKLNVSVQTLRRWDAEGKLIAKRRASGHRYYDEEDARRMLFLPSEEERKTVVYCRVSSAAQKDDLKSQVKAMEQFCLGAGITVDEWIKETGGGMNFKRKKFMQLFDEVAAGKVKCILVAHKDRLVRFGYEFLEHTAAHNDCSIVVVNQESLSPEKEMVEDLLSIVHTFSCRLYGMRKYKKELKSVVMKAAAETEQLK